MISRSRRSTMRANGLLKTAAEMRVLLDEAPVCRCCRKNGTYNGKGVCTPCLDIYGDEIHEILDERGDVPHGQ